MTLQEDLTSMAPGIIIQVHRRLQDVNANVVEDDQRHRDRQQRVVLTTFPWSSFIQTNIVDAVKAA